MSDIGRTPAPRRRPGAALRRAAALAVSCVLLFAACGASSDGLGDANGGIGIAGSDGPTADTESAANGAGPLGGVDESQAQPRTATTGAASPTDRATSPSADENDPTDPEPDPDGLQQALSAGRVPGLNAEDPFHETLAAYWAILHRARQEPWTFDEAELDAVAVGAGRERFLQRVDNLGAAESIVAPDDSRFEVRLSGMRVGTDVAVGEECVLDDLVHVVVRDARTGERYDPPLVTDDRVFTNRYGVTFQLVDGVWKVADRVLIEDREGVSGCARDW